MTGLINLYNFERSCRTFPSSHVLLLPPTNCRYQFTEPKELMDSLVSQNVFKNNIHDWFILSSAKARAVNWLQVVWPKNPVWRQWTDRLVCKGLGNNVSNLRDYAIAEMTPARTLCTTEKWLNQQITEVAHCSIRRNDTAVSLLCADAAVNLNNNIFS